MGLQARAFFDRQPSTAPFDLTEPIKLLDICNLVEDVRVYFRWYYEVLANTLGRTPKFSSKP
jgi:hypothetical protein